MAKRNRQYPAAIANTLASHATAGAGSRANSPAFKRTAGAIADPMSGKAKTSSVARMLTVPNSVCAYTRAGAAWVSMPSSRSPATTAIEMPGMSAPAIDSRS